MRFETPSTPQRSRGELRTLPTVVVARTRRRSRCSASRAVHLFQAAPRQAVAILEEGLVVLRRVRGGERRSFSWATPTITLKIAAAAGRPCPMPASALATLTTTIGVLAVVAIYRQIHTASPVPVPTGVPQQAWIRARPTHRPTTPAFLRCSNTALILDT